MGVSPVRKVVWIPRRVSCTVSVAVDTRPSAASASAGSRGGPGGPAPVANARASSVALGIAPYSPSGSGASTTVLVTLPAPSSVTSITSPGATTLAPPGCR